MKLGLFANNKIERACPQLLFAQRRIQLVKLMKFVADGMLGKLARWLRLAGHDVIYIDNLRASAVDQDEILLNLAKLEKRELLTCDLLLYRRARKSGIRTTFIRTSDVVSQLAEISKKSGHKIEINPENSRCPTCNGLLKPVGKEKIVEFVPRTVLKTRREFWRCSKCGKIYWYGKHWKTIIEIASRYNKLK
ncbi:MAG TPA: hypothetical protein EYP46_01590 [Hadesarchaea archaeon]|nr:hypothetical protein [Hadesarchaea archaeon]